MDKTKIVITVSGGVVNGVYSNNEAIVEILDFDNMGDNGNSLELENKTKDLKEVY